MKKLFKFLGLLLLHVMLICITVLIIFRPATELRAYDQSSAVNSCMKEGAKKENVEYAKLTYGFASRSGAFVHATAGMEIDNDSLFDVDCIWVLEAGFFNDFNPFTAELLSINVLPGEWQGSVYRR